MAGISQTVIGAAESTKNVPAARSVRDVANRIAYLDPDAAPLFVISSRANSAVANNWKFEWIEKELPARWDSVNNGGGYNDSATSVVVNNGKFFSVGDLIVNTTDTGERMLVTGISTNTLTVVRGVGYDGTYGTPAHSISDKADLLIIGNAYQEGALSGSPKSVAEVMPFNYTQIMRTPLAVTRTEENTQNYGGPDRARLRMEKGIEHKIDLERTALFGERNISTSGGDSNNAPRRYTGGVFYYLTEISGTTAKIYDFGGTVTEPELEAWMQDIFEATAAGDQRTLFCSPLWVSILDQLAMGRVEIMDKAETFGVTVRNLVSAHGSLAVVKHRLLQNNPAPTGTTASGYGGYALALDMTRFKYRFLSGGQTSLRTDIQANDYDGFKDEYLTEFGWQVELAKVHGVGKGATA